MTTVLIADDQALVRVGLRKILENDPRTTVAGEAGDGEEAVAAAAQLARLLHGVAAVLRLAGDLDVLLRVEDQPEAAADERLVVRDQDRDHAGSVASGSRARTAKPPPRRGPAANSPSKTVTRSRTPASPWPPL